MGLLVPTACIECIPGDSFKISSEAMLRFPALIAPINAKVNVEIFWFFCPDRILWEQQSVWEDWITDLDSPRYPYVTPTGGSHVGKLLDHLYGLESLPTGQQLIAAPIAGYCKIWDEWFRNQNITLTERWDPLESATAHVSYNAFLTGDPFNRTWGKDYFTSALPWPQKGDAVTLPLLEAGDAVVELNGTNAAGQLRDASTGVLWIGPDSLQSDATGNLETLGSDELFYDPNGTLKATINSAAATINALREAYRLQEFLELNAMGGTRYNELIYAHFGVKIPDARLSRPELIGRQKGRMAISEIPQSAPAAGDATTAGAQTPAGTLAGHGISVLGGEVMNYYVYEHGWLYSIINVQPDTQYQQGINRHFQKDYPMDRFWPKLAHIGEQEILNKEIYRQHSDKEGTFAYAPRYAEYRFQYNRVAGEMRDTLSHWTMSRIFTGDVNLVESFIYANPTARIFANLYTQGGGGSYTGDQIFGVIYHNIYASRLIPKYGRPTL